MAILDLDLNLVKFVSTAPSISPIDVSKRAIEFSHFQHVIVALIH